MLPLDELHVSRTNTCAAGFPPVMRFVALEENATKRPSPLMASRLELLGPLAAPPLTATEMVIVDAVHPVTAPLDDRQVSRKKTSLVPGACVVNTTKRPSALTAGTWLLPGSALPALSTETMVVEGVQLVA